jgi:PAS domain-containing protein
VNETFLNLRRSATMNSLAGFAASDVGFAAGLVAASLLGSLMALAAVTWFVSRDKRHRTDLIRSADADIAFLFDDEALIDASLQARQFLRAAPLGGSDWSRLMMLLLPRFPEIEDRIGRLIEDDRQEYESIDETTRLIAEWRHGLVRITLDDLETSPTASGIDRHGMKAMERELITLRQVVEHTPSLIWRRGPRGQITWANRAYFEMVERVRGREDKGTWPPPVLFEPQSLLRPVDDKEDKVNRVSLTLAGTNRKLWFDCLRHELEDGELFIALDVNAIVNAEEQLRDFMQTLTKTFAHLTIGLAIFDRSRHLALFNPALTDLTQLPVDFLAGRPTLFGFLDRLREKKMIPEPKDYKGWRKRLLELEAAAVDGTYAETWALPSGQTFRVTGRPHPDGAVAFLFENISAEISLTRQFRAELEMGQSVIDSLEEAVAVFSPDSVLAMTNKAYVVLWGDDPGTSLRDIGVTDAMRTWLSRSSPTPVWGEIRDFTARMHEREPWSGNARLNDGRGLDIHVVPLAGGATLVRFAVRNPEELTSAGRDGTTAPRRAEG